MCRGGVLLLDFIQPSHLTYSVNIYRPFPFTICGKAERTAQLHTAIPDTSEMSVDSPQVHPLLKKMILQLVHLPVLYIFPAPPRFLY